MTAPSDYLELATLLASKWARSKPGFVGLAGGQGAGKSTLGRLIEAACAEHGVRVCVLSLDDYYLSRQDRLALAKRVHPLLETRGPPGTHDMARCRDDVSRLRGLERDREYALPIFDKGIDDQNGSRRVRGPFDMVLLEGWCVGARPESEVDSSQPLNALEELKDADGRWRRFVNLELASVYAAFWRDLDYLIFLRVPDIAAVRRWRLQQEDERPEYQRMSVQAVDEFIQYFERTTLSMDRTLPSLSDLIVELAEDHSVRTLNFRSPPSSNSKMS